MKKNSKNGKELTEKQLGVVLDFASQMYNSYTSEHRTLDFAISNRNYFNPFMQNVEEKEKNGIRIKEIPYISRLLVILLLGL